MHKATVQYTTYLEDHTDSISTFNYQFTHRELGYVNLYHDRMSSETVQRGKSFKSILLGKRLLPPLVNYYLPLSQSKSKELRVDIFFLFSFLFWCEELSQGLTKRSECIWMNPLLSTFHCNEKSMLFHHYAVVFVKGRKLWLSSFICHRLS